jgi:hypothetical protein
MWDDAEEYFSKFEDYRESAGAEMDSVIQEIKSDGESRVCIIHSDIHTNDSDFLFIFHQHKMSTYIGTLITAVKSRQSNSAQLCNPARRALIHLCGTFLKTG